MAWECRHSGDLHTCDDGVLVEVLRDGQPVEPGERGEVVVTNLHAYAMPFIRYRIGDLATRGAPCACGAPFSTIGEIQGRMIDYFPLPDGRLLHPYEIVSRLVWGPAEWLRQYQLVQERRDRVVLYAVVAEPASGERLEEVERTVRPLLGHGVEFVIDAGGPDPFEIHREAASLRSLVQLRVRPDPLRADPSRRRAGGSSAPDRYHPPIMRRRFYLHCVASLRSLQGLTEAIPGFDRYPERALLLAGEGDAVCVPRAGRSRLSSASWRAWVWDRARSTSSSREATDAGLGRPLAERLLGDPGVLSRAAHALGADEVTIEPYAATADVMALAEVMEREAGIPVRVDGSPRVTRYADQKHHMRAKAQELGIPVAEGEVAELAYAGGRRRRDLEPVRAAVERQLRWSARVIVRGSSRRVGLLHLRRRPRRRRSQRPAPPAGVPRRQPVLPGRGDGRGHGLAQRPDPHPHGRRAAGLRRHHRPALEPGPDPRRQPAPLLGADGRRDGGVGPDAGELDAEPGLHRSGRLRLRGVPRPASPAGFARFSPK